MYKFHIALFAAIITLTSCEKENIQPIEEDNNTRTVENDCAWTFELTAGQNMNAGTVTVSNDNNFIYVTYTTTGQWSIYETHLYVGHPDDLPKNGGGNPQIGQFPYSETHYGVTSYTYAVPIDPDLNCYIVAAHATVGLMGENGEPTQFETAWVNQCEINPDGGSWAMYAKYCLMDCEGDGFNGDGDVKPQVASTKSK